MRCKRCGEILEPTDTRCPVCGKTLTPPRKRPQSQKPSETNIKLPQLEKFTFAYGQDVARSRMLQLVTIGAVVVMLALLVLVYVAVGEVQSAMNRVQQTSDALLKNQQQVQQEQPPAPTESATQVPQEPDEQPTAEPAPQQPALPLSRQDMEATVTLHYTGGNAYAAAAMDLGDYEDSMTPWVSTTMDYTERRTNVSMILGSAGDRLDVQLRDSYGVGDYQVDIALTWDLKGSTFRNLANPMCVWECRVTGGQWQSIPASYLTPVAGGCELKLLADELTLLMAQYSQMELRCQVTFTHPDGGIMNLVVDGIAIDSQGLLDSGDLPG